jgi:hypothetical protein
VLAEYKGCSITEETELSQYCGWHVSPRLSCLSPPAKVLSFSDSLTSVVGETGEISIGVYKMLNIYGNEEICSGIYNMAMNDLASQNMIEMCKK